MIRSSMVSLQSSRWTKTFLVCPMRYAREMVWFSIDGLNCGSQRTTTLAAWMLSLLREFPTGPQQIVGR